MFSNPKKTIRGLKGKKMNSLPNKLTRKQKNILSDELAYSKSAKNRPYNCRFRPPNFQQTSIQLVKLNEKQREIKLCNHNHKDYIT